jgi:hypothetical protein
VVLLLLPLAPMFGHLWVPLVFGRAEPLGVVGVDGVDEVDGVVAVLWLVVGVLDVDVDAAFAIAAPPAASAPVTVRAAIVVAIRLRIMGPFLSSGPSSQLALCRRTIRQT